TLLSTLLFLFLLLACIYTKSTSRYISLIDILGPRVIQLQLADQGATFWLIQPAKDTADYHWDFAWAGLSLVRETTAASTWHAGSSRYYLDLPYWLLLPTTALLPAIYLATTFRRHLRARRRLTAGLCPTCGYDLRATPERCPECGTPSPSVRGPG
ncbi:MAG TPA: hypothetical protein VNT26_19690, partial [Candidatus Sulfotelmatobacter sp.]|nr:hypothetical protein [Candidatus Sulfotelmatobacter sp.]